MCVCVCVCRGVGSGRSGGGGSDVPSFLGANFVHFLYKVLGQRSVEFFFFFKLTFKTTPP